MIPLNNRTRWNSWYILLIVADEYASSIDMYAKSYFNELSKDYLSPVDWKRLHTIMIFLQPFYRATLETQGHRATLEKVLFTMDVLVQYFKKSIVSKYNLLSNIYQLILYNRFNIMPTKTFVPEFKKNGMFSTSITAKQTLLLCMLPPLFCILAAVWTTSTQIGQ